MAQRKVKAKKQEEIKVKVPALDLGLFKMTLNGDTPLIVNKFSEKSKTEMEEKHLKTAKQKKGIRYPEKEYMAALYTINNNGRTGMPAGGVKNCFVSACRNTDLKMTEARGAFHVLPTAEGNLLEIKGKHVMDSSIVRVGNFGNKKAMTRYRPRYDKWSVEVPIRYNKRMISPEQIVNLANNAGFSVGLCEHRPEKNGTNGMFSVKTH